MNQFRRNFFVDVRIKASRLLNVTANCSRRFKSTSTSQFTIICETTANLIANYSSIAFKSHSSSYHSCLPKLIVRSQAAKINLLSFVNNSRKHRFHPKSDVQTSKPIKDPLWVRKRRLKLSFARIGIITRRTDGIN